MRLSAAFFVAPDGTVTPKAPLLSNREKLFIFRRDGAKCMECGEPVQFGGNCVSPFDRIKSGAIDHTFPRSRGGQNDHANLRLLCQSCNAAKGARTPEEWRA